jgi:hypothetical protein
MREKQASLTISFTVRSEIRTRAGPPHHKASGRPSFRAASIDADQASRQPSVQNRPTMAVWRSDRVVRSLFARGWRSGLIEPRRHDVGHVGLSVPFPFGMAMRALGHGELLLG